MIPLVFGAPYIGRILFKNTKGACLVIRVFYHHLVAPKLAGVWTIKQTHTNGLVKHVKPELPQLYIETKVILHNVQRSNSYIVEVYVNCEHSITLNNIRIHKWIQLTYEQQSHHNNRVHPGMTHFGDMPLSSVSVYPPNESTIKLMLAHQ